ncbi:MAG: tyrosine-type recombinase/integrase, partial [Sphaerobacter sp.]|nr:tyrosine-type recombinase/integrase [Sphaerobacter sp.]
ARAKLEALKQEAQAPAPPTPSSRRSSPSVPTVAQFVEQWLESATLKPTTEWSYRNSLKAHVLPVIGQLRLDQVTPADVARIVAVCRKKGKSDRTAQYAYSITRRLLQVAMDWELIEQNPAAKVARPQVEQTDRMVWTVEQSQAFLQHCLRGEGKWDTLFLLALTTGLRLGELLGLTWEDIDLEKGTLRVSRNVVETDRGVFVEQTPKSRHSRRSVSLPQAAVQALRVWREMHPYGPLFRQRNGLPPRRHAIHTALRRRCQRWGLPYIGFHGLRHQHVSLLAHAGVPVKVAQQRVGHSTPMLTLGIYTHVLGNADRESADSFDRLLLAD